MDWVCEICGTPSPKLIEQLACPLKDNTLGVVLQPIVKCRVIAVI
jgi:hypothetical protein